MSKVDKVLEDIEIYTIGRPKHEDVHISVVQLQRYVDKIRKILNESCECKMLLGSTFISYGCVDSVEVDEYNRDIKYCKYCGKPIKFISNVKII